jgi:predicted dehydrogenase
MNEVRLITLDPGHFHAALIQKEMYPEVSKRSTVYGPLGPDVIDHLQRVARFNLRADRPTAWEIDVHTSPDFLERMIAERPGNVVVLSGRNRRKIDLIQASVNAGLHVLADKPWIIDAADLLKLDAVLAEAEKNRLVAYDITTERYEITAILQREMVNDPDVFGSALPGTAEEPGVYMESVHHIMKLVAGVPNQRPPWFFDVKEQGEALADVGTHLVDLTQWILFPDQVLDVAKDIRILGSTHWPTRITPAQFRQVTGHTAAADQDYYCNTQVMYALRGILVKMDVLWNYEAPAGTGDTHFAVFRGSLAHVDIRQAAPENYRPELYVVPNAGSEDAVRAAVCKRVASLQAAWPGVAMAEQAGEMRIVIPDAFRVGHEAHFAQVTRQFFEYLKKPESMPAWERPGMLAKYTVSTTPAA